MTPDPTETGALEASYRDSHDLEYQTNTFQEVPLAEKVENAGNIIQGARTVEGDEMRVGWEREQAIEQGVNKRPDERVDPDRQDMTTAVIERINGEQDETERHLRKARRAQEAEHDRAEASREAVSSMDRQYRTRGSLDDPDVDAVPAAESDLNEHGVSQHQPVPDTDDRPTVETLPENPWSQLSQDDVAAVNKNGARLYDELGDDLTMSRATLTENLAKRVAAGESLTTAVFDIKGTLELMPEVAQSISDIDPFGQYQTTVEGEITTLWNPKDTSQYQVGLIQDDSGETAKFTIWQAAGDKPMLHEGDEIRVERVKVNAYTGGDGVQTTLAVDSEAEITHLSEGDGPARRLGIQSPEPTRAPWDVDSDQHSWANGAYSDNEN
jgi:hypothetical protein